MIKYLFNGVLIVLNVILIYFLGKMFFSRKPDKGIDKMIKSIEEKNEKIIADNTNFLAMRKKFRKL